MRGVTPDVILPSVANEMEVGESMHDYALPWDTIPSAKFTRLDRIAPHLDELRRRAEARQTTDRDWDYVREDIALYREAMADKSLSLNYEQRVREKETADARSKQRKAERASREASTEKTYELTLKLVGEPGLPPAVGSTNAPAATAEHRRTTTLASAEEDAEAEEDTDTTPATDVALKEAKRILLDYLELAASTPAKSPPVASKQ
ncbi:MAG: carboxy terminal-processing peptidase [Verrucomicrobia bacterium]|nr:carboxy terminal-processing peptidase [Verrucomicrobiota bacterium]